MANGEGRGGEWLPLVGNGNGIDGNEGRSRLWDNGMFEEFEDWVSGKADFCHCECVGQVARERGFRIRLFNMA